MSLPTGIICLWYGAIVNIPAGWIICDGNNGTPDLRDKFIVGAGSTYAVDANGGAAVHNHAFTGNGHVHSLGAGTDLAAGVGFSDDTSLQPTAGATDNGSSLPPYHALAYIMKT